MLLNCGVDQGYSFIQGKSKENEIKFDSYIKEISKDEALNIADSIRDVNELNLLVKYNGKYFILGKLASQVYSSLTKKLSKDRMNVFSTVYHLACLGLLCESREIEVNLAVGMPNRSRKEKKDLETFLKGQYEFSFLYDSGEIVKYINIKNVYAMPQPVACAFVLPEEERDNKKIMVVDVGHGTSDILFLDQMRVSNDAGMRFCGRGVEKLYKILKDRILNKYSESSEYIVNNISEKEIQRIIESNGKYYINGKIQDIKDIFTLSFEEYADDLFDEIESNFTILPEADLILGSGGIFNNIDFTKYFANKFKNYGLTFVTEKSKPQWTVVNGLYIFSNLYFEDDNTNKIKQPTERVEEVNE